MVLFLMILIIVQSVPPIFGPSDKYIKTGVVQITSSQFQTGIINNGYSVTLSGCAFSSNVYKVGLGLYSLDIKFDGLKILYDIQVSSTSVSIFEINFSTTMGNLINLLKVCYVIKNPSYSDLFYIQNYRYTGGTFIITSAVPYTQTISLTTPFPVSSIGSINERTFLYSFNLESKDPGIQNNLDIYPNTMIIDQSTIQLKLSTLYDDVKVFFFAVTIVLYDDVQVTASGLSRFTISQIESSTSDSDLFIDTSPITMFTYNTYLGLKAFHARTLQTPNFLNFQTSFPSETFIRFQSANNVNWGYMRFEILISEAAGCPTSEPYFIYYLGDCQASIPTGFIQNCEGNILLDFQMNLKYLLKKPQKNQVQIMFNLEPSDPTLNTILSQTNWNNALNIDIPGTKTIEYINSPFPQVKITVDYIQNLDTLQKSITISAYDSTIYPANFKGMNQKKISIILASSNNLAVNFYDDSIYNTSKIFNYVFLALSCLYMIFFLIGMILGKVYILQMTFVPQVTFLSLVSLENVSPTMSSLSFLKYVFRYWYSQDNGMIFSSEGMNYMKLMGISDDFLLNYNVMLIFFIITFVLGIVFHFQNKPKAKRFFLLDTPMYLMLWFGMWILFTGQIQIRTLIFQKQGSALSYCGIVFFTLLLVLFLAYFGLYYKKLTQIKSFYNLFSKRLQTHKKQQKTKYFYLILFLQRIFLASLFANVFGSDYLNLVAIGVNITMIVLIVIFKPYKFRIPSSQAQQKISLIRPNIRQILNYSILIIILVFLFITNQIQQSKFTLYIPVIVMVLLFINIILTIFFLISDKRLQQDLQQLKKLFDPQQQKRQQKRETKNLPVQKPQETDRKFRQQDIKVGIIAETSPKDTLLYKKSDFDRSFQVSISPLKNSRQPNHYDLRYLANQNQRDNFTIDEQLMKVAQKNQQLYRRKVKQGNDDQYSPPKQVTKIKSYHSIMKGTSNKKGLSYQKHSNYFEGSQQEED